MSRPLIAALLMLVSLLLVPACTDEGGTNSSTVPPGLPSGIELARVGTIGDYPPADLSVVVNMDKDGRIEVEGAEVAFENLKALLVLHAGKSRNTDAPYRPSRTHAVLRIDRSIPWKAAAWVMQECAHPEVRMDKVSFAVLPEEGDEEGTLATHLPWDRGLAKSSIAPEQRVSKVQIRRTGGMLGTEFLYEALRSRSGSGGARVFLEPEDFVPIGVVLETVDVLHRAGVKQVDFRGVPPSRRGKDIATLVADARKLKLDPEFLLDGKPLPITIGGGIHEMPPVERVRGDFAGTFDRGNDARWEEYKRDFVGRKPIEKEEPVIEDPVIRDVASENFVPSNAVDHALIWLRDHQQPDGRWRCDAVDVKDSPYDPGVTALTVLAFLNAGETHKQGIFRKNVRMAFKYLKRIQDPEGCFGPRDTPQFTYNHAIATLAMAHAFALTKSPLFKQSAQHGVDFIAKCRNTDLAWRHGVRPGDNDTSVSGWMMAALHVAKKAGLRVDDACYTGMRAWLDKVTNPENGRVGYLARGTGAAVAPGRPWESLTAIGVMSRIFLGEKPGESAPIRKGVALLGASTPAWGEEGKAANMYYWYWGALAMYSCGGQGWRQWNMAFKEVVMGNQRMEFSAFKGSWDPAGPWGKHGGRTYATALGAICMEVYYRYFKVAGLDGR